MGAERWGDVLERQAARFAERRESPVKWGFWITLVLIVAAVLVAASVLDWYAYHDRFPDTHWWSWLCQ